MVGALALLSALAARLPAALHPRRCGPTPDKCQYCFRFWSDSQPNYTNGMPDWPVYQGADGLCHKVCATAGRRQGLHQK